MDVITGTLRFAGGFVPAFVLTWLIESIVYLVAFRSLGFVAAAPALRQAQGAYGAARGADRQAQGVYGSVGRIVLLALVVNVATHPLLWLFVSAVPGVAPLLVAEGLAVLVEGTILALVLRRHLRPARVAWVWAYLSALLANGVSWLVGVTIDAPVLSALAAAGSSACC